MAINKRWAQDEEHVLRSIVGEGRAVRDAALTLGRSVSACYIRMQVLGIAADKDAAQRLRSEALRRPVRDRFFAKVLLDQSGCWLWTGATDTKGYGQMRIDRRGRLATHVSLQLDGREQPHGAFALHSCDNPACVNPAHLRWGTAKENSRDMIDRGRANLSGLELGRGVKRPPLSVCKRGHDRTQVGALINGKSCRQCVNARKRQRRAEAAA